MRQTAQILLPTFGHVKLKSPDGDRIVESFNYHSLYYPKTAIRHCMTQQTKIRHSAAKELTFRRDAPVALTRSLGSGTAGRLIEGRGDRSQRACRARGGCSPARRHGDYSAAAVLFTRPVAASVGEGDAGPRDVAASSGVGCCRCGSVVR